MHYSNSPSMVRAEFFKDYDGSTKWGYTEALDMSDYWDVTTAVHAVALAWRRSGRLLSHYRIVVFDPYHRNAHPVMLTMQGRIDCIEDIAKWRPELIQQIMADERRNANA